MLELAAPEVELACRPRFGTPRDISRTTMGGAVAEVSRRLGRPLMPWQRHVVDVALELDPDGSYHYDEVVLLVPRQSGKTALIMALMVHRLVVAPLMLGRQRVTYTAQKRQDARKKLERDFAEALRAAEGEFVEVTHARAKPQLPVEWKLSLNNGQENIQFGRGNYLQIDAPSRTGGHGDTLDVGVIDEAWAHEDNTVEVGMDPAMATRRCHQHVVLSAAGEARSFYLWRKVVAGRKACESGRHGRTAYFEWSAAPGEEPGDPATWRRCSPALGITISERTLQGYWEKAVRGGPDAVDEFCRSYLNMWPVEPVLEEMLAGSDLNVDGWLSLADPDAARGSGVVFGVDVDQDRLAHIAVAWRRPDGKPHVMLADTGLSPLRTPGRLRELEAKWQGPVMLGGPSSALEGDVARARIITSSEFASGFGWLGDLVAAGELRHGNQAELNASVESARTRAFGAAGERTLVMRDAPEVGPLAAVVRALAGLQLGAGAPTLAPASAATTRSSRAVGSETADLSTLEF